ncbi:MAG: glycosyltransferase family 2 protein [Candidatus Kerfeldbacteria bacterium]|nr:glycosyltransferase family 2 protein [Candidatus Kerfeldbacteria bacterium]
MDVSIIIVSWNSRQQIRRCLDSIFNTQQAVSREIFVVDNASTDGTQEIIESYGSIITAIYNKKNFGFARACNQAISQSQGECIILLNPDTVLTNNSLNATVSFFAQHAEAGIMGPHLIFPDGSTQWSVRRFPDLLSHMIILTKLHNFFPNISILQHYYCSQFNYTLEAPVDQVMGAFFAFRRSLVNLIGLLDERYFIWYEEVDYCYRAASKGWKTFYNPAIQIVHEKAASFKQRQPYALQLIMCHSMLHYFFKNKGVLYYILLLPFAFLNIILGLLQSVFRIHKVKRNL